MRAVTMQRGEFSVDELPDLVPQKGEVLVRTRACGICGSDLHAAKHTEDFVNTSRQSGGAFQLTTFDPVVLGHEFCAEVVDYGPSTERQLRPGTLVCCPPMLRREPPEPIGFSVDAPGGFSEFMLLTESIMTPVPSGLSAEHAALTEPMAVSFHAVNKARLEGDEAILVIGCGPVGLAVIIALKQRRAGPIIAVDFSPGRRALAALVGADDALDPAITNPYAHPDLMKSEQCVYFECVGVPGMIDQMFLGAQKNARLVIIGVCLQQDISRPLIAVNKQLNVQYVLGYTTEEFQETLEYIGTGDFDVTPLITGETNLEGVADAFTELANPEKHAKILVKP